MKRYFLNAEGERVMTGYFWVDDIPLMQTPGVADLFPGILQGFDQIIEIGFHTGGLSLMLHLAKPPACVLVSYDITRIYLQVPDSYGIDFRIGDCLGQDTAQEIVALIQAPKRTLVLCDGGDKHNEFANFGRFLKPNDAIMLHDFAESLEEYDELAREVGWNTPPESYFEAIAPFVKQYGLEKFHYGAMKAVFWGSFYKPPA
jgi:hypothetical protein